MKIVLLAATLLFSSFLLLSCKKDNPVVPPPPEPPKAVTLCLVDVSCTEAFIKVTAADSVVPVSIKLTKNDSTFLSFTLTSSDTIVIDTSLHPNTTYTYQTTSVINGKEEKDDTLQVQSLIVTSDNFTWQTFTFGNYAAAIFYDCAIISEADIWCVGTFSILDTSQTSYTTYNAVHWNGSEWEQLSIPYNYQGQQYYHPIHTIFAFNSNDVWFCGNGIIHWDGNQYIPIPIPTSVWGPYQINKIWGISDTDFYIAGNVGNIAHYQNGIWNKLISGTTLNLNDIYGYCDENTGEQTILVAGGNILESTERIILQITANQVQEINSVGTIEYPLGCVWIPNTSKYYIAGTGLYKKYNFENEWKQIPIPYYYIYSVRGDGLNNIVVTGGKGYVGHFDGIIWVNYIGNGLEETSGNYYSASIKGNTIAVVGDLAEGQAIVVIGRH